jgi:hypothetical protein
MADVLVMCPGCGLYAKVTGNHAIITTRQAKCEHRQNPANCPMLEPLIFRILVRRTVQRQQES